MARKSNVRRCQDDLIKDHLRHLNERIRKERSIMHATSRKVPTETKTRYVVGYDQDATFEECNGESRPLTESEYAENFYNGKDGKPIAYAEYLRYYGNPDRHVYLFVQREDRCPCCGNWHQGGSLYNIDCMDDDPSVSEVGTHTIDQLSGYLKEVAGDLEPAEFKTPAPSAVLNRVIDILYDRKAKDWRELNSCADAIQDLTIALQHSVR